MADSPAPPKLYLDEWIALRELTLEEVAERSGLSKTHVAQIKSGKRAWNERVLVKLARGLDLRDPLSLFRAPNAGGAERAAIWDRIPAARRDAADRAVDHALEAFADPPATRADGNDGKRARKHQS
jgi:transcriptional regulator with XRE-family HTH domain